MRKVKIALLVCGLSVAGCHREHRQITPTTLGTDFQAGPRGKMTPQPWPGTDLSKARPRTSPTIDPETAMASGKAAPR